MREQRTFIRFFLILFFTVFIVFSVLSLILNVKTSPTGLVLCGGTACSLGASLTVVEEQSSETVIDGNIGTTPESTGSITKSKQIYIDKSHLEVNIIQGETKKETIVITNPSTKDLKIKLETENLPDFLSFNENEFTLKPGEKKSITIGINTPDDASLFTYKGNLSIMISGILAKLMPIEIIVIPKEQPAYDIILEIPFEYEEVTAGGKLLTTIRFSRIKGTGKIDANLEYVIKDENENIVYREEETLLVETQTSFIKKIEIPQELKTGKYYLRVKASYNDISMGTSTASFKVIEKKNIEEPSIIHSILPTKEYYWIILLGFIFLAGILILVIEIVKIKRIKNRKVIENMVKKAEEKNEKNKVVPYFK
jgi:hypothetical protein